MRLRYLWVVLLLAMVVVDVIAEAGSGSERAVKKKKKSSKKKKSKVPKVQADEPQTAKPPSSISYPDPEYDYPTYYDEKEDYNENSSEYMAVKLVRGQMGTSMHRSMAMAIESFQ